MKLYVCNSGTVGPGAMHPCAKAGKALDDAGYKYELKKFAGGKLMFWTWKNRDRDRQEVREVSGQNDVPVLVLDNGEVITSSSAIARWAKENPAPGT